MKKTSTTTKRVSPDVIKSLIRICGEECVSVSGGMLDAYSHDEAPRLKSLPECVVFPESRDQVSKILKLCYEKNIPVTPRGAGTGVTGGAIPVSGGLVLSLEKMNRIIEIDTDNLMAVVEPGVVTADLKRAAEAHGLFYPPDPASMDACTIGGNLAECAGGAMSVKYGVTKNYVTGLDVVYPDGSGDRLGGKIVKNVAGYDLISLLVGSEGTLAVITQATLKLIPKPQFTRSILVSFDKAESSGRMVGEILKGKIVPSAIELLDHRCVSAVQTYTGKSMTDQPADVYLLIQLTGDDERVLDGECELIRAHAAKNDGKNFRLAANQKEESELWELRRQMRPALKSFCRSKVSEDIVVPRARIADCIRRIRALEKKYRMNIFCYGHAGDGNLHVQVLRIDESDAVWNKNIPHVIREIFKTAIDLGGTITAEHGIGLSKMPYLPMAIGAKSLGVMRDIKNVLDPKGILNPGKIFLPKQNRRRKK